MTTTPQTITACPTWCYGGHASSPATHYGTLDEHRPSVRVNLEHCPERVGVSVAIGDGQEANLDGTWEVDDLIQRLVAARAALGG